MRAPAILLAIPLTVGCALGLLICTSTGAAAHVGGQSADVFAACAAAAALLALIGCVGALAAASRGCARVDRLRRRRRLTRRRVVGRRCVGPRLSVAARRLVRCQRSRRAPGCDSGQPARGRDADRDRCLAGARRPRGRAVRHRRAGRIAPIHDSRRPDVPPFTIHGLTPSCATRGGVRLSVAGTLAPGAMGEWRKGRHVRVAASLREPTTYRNPGVPDEQRALARRGIALVGSVKSAAMVEVVAPGSRRDEWTSSFRAWVRAVLSGTVGPWSARSAGVAAAIAIGDRTGLAQDDEERLQAAGTYHVIAISGGNIAILTLLLVGAAGWLGASPRVGAAATIVVLLAYGQVTGPAPSVDRAISAAVLFLAGRLIDLRGPSINILAVAATLGLSLSPMAVFDPGFLLSFGATLGILIGVPRLATALTPAGDDGVPPDSHTSPRGAFAARPDAPPAGIAAGPGPPALDRGRDDRSGDSRGRDRPGAHRCRAVRSPDVRRPRLEPRRDSLDDRRSSRLARGAWSLARRSRAGPSLRLLGTPCRARSG